MNIISVLFTAKPGKADALRAVLLAHASDLLDNEPGCRQFDVAADPADPTRVFIYEVYDDPAAMDAHRASEHFKRNSPRIAELVADRTRHDLVILPGARPKR